MRLFRRRAPGVNVVGWFRAESGVGEAARAVVGALRAAHVEVAAVHPLAGSASRQGHTFDCVASADAPHGVNLLCLNANETIPFVREAGDAFFEGRPTAGLWWWEVDRFQPLFAEGFEPLDEVWAGSDHVAAAVGADSPVPVHRVTIPVTAPRAAKAGRAALGLPEGFLFLFMFGYYSVFDRKNPLGAIEAFTRAFPPGSGAALAIKTIDDDSDPANRDRLRAAAAAHPDVHLLEGYVSAEEAEGMIAACDSYVSLHRSEGFGFTPAEAMALGKPVIATGYSGTLEYMTPENSFLVGHELVPVGPRQGPYPAEARWAEPDVAEAAAYMRAMFESPEARSARGARAARDLEERHAPAVAGETMRERLRALAPER